MLSSQSLYSKNKSVAIDYAGINSAACKRASEILARWLPDGRVSGRDYVAKNPTRDDRNLGSFRINHGTGQWIDFATGDKGGDFISLAAYLHQQHQWEAAIDLSVMLGVNDEY